MRYVCLSSVSTLAYSARYANGENNQAEREGDTFSCLVVDFLTRGCRG